MFRAHRINTASGNSNSENRLQNYE